MKQKTGSLEILNRIDKALARIIRKGEEEGIRTRKYDRKRDKLFI